MCSASTRVPTATASRKGGFDLIDAVPLGLGPRPNHVEFELPGTPNAGQTVCSAFDVSDPLRPAFIAQMPLDDLSLPSGALRHKKSINLVYGRVGGKGPSA